MLKILLESVVAKLRYLRHYGLNFLLEYIDPIFLYQTFSTECSIRVYQSFSDLFDNIKKYWEGLPAI